MCCAWLLKTAHVVSFARLPWRRLHRLALVCFSFCCLRCVGRVLSILCVVCGFLRPRTWCRSPRCPGGACTGWRWAAFSFFCCCLLVFEAAVVVFFAPCAWRGLFLF